MSDSIKLYKCYKGTCSRCLDEENPYITEDEYKDMLDVDGNIQCPEGHIECGIQELKSEDLPKPPTGNKKKLVLAGICVLLILTIGIGGYTYYWFSKAKNTVKAGIDVVEKVTDLVEESGAIPIVKGKLEEVSQTQTGAEPEQAQKEQAPKSSDAIGITPPPDKEPKRGEPACNQISASSLEDFLSKVADKRIPSCEKDDMLKNYTKFFQSSAFVNIVDNNGSVMRRFGAKDYVTRLNGSGKQVFVQDGGEKQGNKYTELMVTEI